MRIFSLITGVILFGCFCSGCAQRNSGSKLSSNSCEFNINGECVEGFNSLTTYQQETIKKSYYDLSFSNNDYNIYCAPHFYTTSGNVVNGNIEIEFVNERSADMAQCKAFLASVASSGGVFESMKLKICRSSYECDAEGLFLESDDAQVIESGSEEYTFVFSLHIKEALMNLWEEEFNNLPDTGSSDDGSSTSGDDSSNGITE